MILRHNTTFTKRMCDRCGSLQKGGMLESLSWCCIESAIHHKRDVHKQQHTNTCDATSNNRVISSSDLYCCLLPQCGALHLPLELFRDTRTTLSCLLHAQYMKMTRDDNVLGFGFKSCDISICWWISVLLFFLKQIWIGIDYFLLNFFATFGSVFGTAGSCRTDG